MEENKIFVNADEYSRLCRQDGKLEALKAYIESEEAAGGYIATRAVKAIIGMDSKLKKRLHENYIEEEMTDGNII